MLSHLYTQTLHMYAESMSKARVKGQRGQVIVVKNRHCKVPRQFAFSLWLMRIPPVAATAKGIMWYHECWLSHALTAQISSHQ